MKYVPTDIRWEVLPPARKVHDATHGHLSADRQRESVEGLRHLLCDFFSSAPQCDTKGNGISPMGGTSEGKVFKVRWALPGMGKRGGLRLAVLAKCPEKHIIIAKAWVRKDDPSDEEITAAIDEVHS